MKKLSAISLFTGAGGLDLGFEAAGFETKVAVEFDKRCTETLNANREWAIISRDISEISTAELLDTGGLDAGEADILIGGPPCQPFSKSGFWASGDSRRLSDPRANTLTEYLRVLRETRPKTFLLENVEGLGFRKKNEGLSFFVNQLQEVNAAVGTNYSVAMAVLNAVDFGVPQLRRRLFLVGSRDGTSFQFPEPTHGSPSECAATNKEPYRTAWDALHDLDENDPTLAPRGKWAKLLPTVPEGQNYLWHTSRGGGLPLFGWRRRYWTFLLKLAKAKPAWTLQAQPGPATGPFHWSNRRLSKRDMARIQTFPDNYRITGSIADAQKQLGNAVPALLAEVLARAIRQQLLKQEITGELKHALPQAPPPLPPEKVLPVPSEYLTLRGVHEAHPGTGRGYRASLRPSEA